MQLVSVVSNFHTTQTKESVNSSFLESLNPSLLAWTRRPYLETSHPQLRHSCDSSDPPESTHEILSSSFLPVTGVSFPTVIRRAAGWASDQAGEIWSRWLGLHQSNNKLGLPKARTPSTIPSSLSFSDSLAGREWGGMHYDQTSSRTCLTASESDQTNDLLPLGQFISQCKCEYVSSIESLFKQLRVIGQGTYGIVYEALNQETKKVVALKRLRWEDQHDGVPATSVREITILRTLDHPNIVNLQGVYYEPSEKGCPARLYLEFEYLERDLRKYMKTFPQRRMPISFVKVIIFQLLKGLAYCHARRIIHRDIKPNNILVAFCQRSPSSDAQGKRKATESLPRPATQRRRTTAPRPSLSRQNQQHMTSDSSPFLLSSCKISAQLSTTSEGGLEGEQISESTDYSHGTVREETSPGSDKGIWTECNNEAMNLAASIQVKIADFGLARVLPVTCTPMTHEVVTLWYRAPEILLGLSDYTPAVDIWGVGCVFAELLYGGPTFAGNAEVDTLFKIFQLLGTPDSKTWPCLETLPHFNSAWPRWQRRPDRFERLRPEPVDPEAKDLLKKLLDYNHRTRLTAQEALQHPWFETLLH